MIRTQPNVLDKTLGRVAQCFTGEVAEKIAALRASTEVQDRLDFLADRCTEGLLTDDERAEYDHYLQALDSIAYLQAQARAILKAGSRG